jgi:hypothetical protein
MQYKTGTIHTAANIKQAGEMPPRLRLSLVSWMPLLLLLSVSSTGDAVRKEDPWDYYPQRPVGIGWLNYTDHFKPGQINRASSVIGIADNQLLIADCFNNRLQVATVHDDKKRRYQILGGYGTQPGSFLRPYGLASTGQHIFVSDSHNHRIQKLSWPDFTVVASAGSYGTGAGQLNFPSAVAIASSALYVADTRNHRVSVYTLDLVYQFSFGSRGAGPANFSFPVRAPAGRGPRALLRFSLICFGLGSRAEGERPRRSRIVFFSPSALEQRDMRCRHNLPS